MADMSFSMDPISAGMNFVGGLMANNSAKKAAKRQMEFQERMSNTVHQREVADLKAAGLNPILSANNGAPTASGALADVGNNVLGAAASSGQSSFRMKAEIDNMKEQNRVLASQVELNKANAAAAHAATAQTNVVTQGVEADNQQKLVDAQMANTPLGVIKSFAPAAAVIGLGGAATGYLGGKISSAYSSYKERSMMNRALGKGSKVVSQGRGLKIQPKGLILERK